MKKTPLQDYADWKNGNTTTYAGFTVRPKRDMGGWPTQEGCPEPHGWVVTPESQAIINALPGATWSASVNGALTLIDVFLAVEQDGQRFWHLLRAIQRMTGVI